MESQEKKTKRELPKPVDDRGWSKVWIRDDLDDLGGCESFIWRTCIRQQIELALAEYAHDQTKAFYINLGFGNEPGKDWKNLKMDDLFQFIDRPKTDEDMAFISLVDELSEVIWDTYEKKSAGYRLFQFRCVALTQEEMTKAWEEGHSEF